MKLYVASGTCSLFPHILAHEAGIPLALERVDLASSPRRTETGADYLAISPNGYVPALEMDGGEVLTEGVAIAQYLLDQRPDSGLLPPTGTFARYKALSWLTFVSSELHKAYSPWLFHAEVGDVAQDTARRRIAQRLAFVERHLQESGPYLMGDHFTAPDAYLFTIVGWSSYAKVDLSPFAALRRFMAQVGSRPSVRNALKAERGELAA